MKVFLTGSKQIGKSTLIQKFIQENQVPCSGYITLPYFEKDERIGFYLHSLVSLERNDILFSHGKQVVKGVFDDFGVEILEHSNSGLLILDEIGFLERDERKYLDVLIKKIKEYPNVLGVCRKIDISYIEEIKHLPEVIVYDLDHCDFEEVKKAIETLWAMKK